MRNHEHALVCSDGEVQVVETSEGKEIKRRLQDVNAQLEHEWQRAESLASQLGTERDILQITMENTEAQLAYLDRDFNFLLVNRAYEESCGHTRRELLGHNHFDFFPNEENQAIFEHARDSAEAVEFKAKPFRFADQPWRGTTYWDWTLTPTKDSSGQVKGLVFSLVDVTDTIRIQQFDESLRSISDLIHSTLDADKMIRRVVVEAANSLPCETTGVLLRDGDGWVVRCTHGFGDDVRDGVRLRDEEVPVAMMAEQSKEPVIVAEVQDDPRTRDTMGKNFGISSMMNVPLIARDTVVGVLGFHCHAEPVAFSPAQVAFAAKLGSTLSLALENARLYEQQRRIAQTLQMSLTRPVPDVSPIEIGLAYGSAFEMALVGGDFYDVFEVEDDKLSVLIGDVSGKGIEAAGLTETIRSSVRSLSYIDPSPAFVLTRVNAMLAREIPEDMFASAALLVIDRRSGEIRATSAGHPAPIIRGAACGYAELTQGMLLGVTDEAYLESRMRLRPGDTLLLYTDGILEARNGDGLFGEVRLLKTVAAHPKRHPQALVNAVLDQAAAFAEGKLEDDVALLALRFRKSSG